MATADGLRRFLAKRGIPVKAVYHDDDGLAIVVKGKGDEVLRLLGSTAEETIFTIYEIKDSWLAATMWRIKLLARQLLWHE